jgi:hypothetical protein
VGPSVSTSQGRTSPTSVEQLATAAREADGPVVRLLAYTGLREALEFALSEAGETGLGLAAALAGRRSGPR